MEQRNVADTMTEIINNNNVNGELQKTYKQFLCTNNKIELLYFEKKVFRCGRESRTWA